MAVESPLVAGQAAGLRIVVIAGEDAVNIIQQKTAVAPIVEVRDRNNLPVAGVSVTFTIGGGNNATFAGGLRTLTVTTNAAGRAAAGTVNPLASGSFQINVQAVSQGQTATATINQSNVLTASQAQGQKGSGGLSTRAIAGIAGAAAGGVVVASAVKMGKSAAPPAAPAPTAPASSARFDGRWIGAGAATSSLSTQAIVDFSFQVTNGVVTTLNIKFEIATPPGSPDSSCGGSGTIEDLPIDRESFSRGGDDLIYAYSVTGAFTSSSVVSGTAVLTRQPIAAAYCGNATINWRGVKQ
jgi:hypothetical protein